MKGLGFRNHMLMLALLPAILVAVLLSVIYVSWNFHEVEVSLRERGRAVAKQLGTAAEYGIFSGSREMLRALADAAQKGDPDIMGITILGERGQVLVRVGDSTPQPLELGELETVQEKSDRIVLVVPVVGTVLPVDDIYSAPAPAARTSSRASGYVVLDLSRQRLVEVRNTQMLIGLDIALGGLLLGVWLALRMARGITRPLIHIIDVVERIGRGELGARVIPDEVRTLQSLGHNINAMAERVTLAHGELQQKVAQATEELRKRKEEAEMLARMDVLTGIPNRRAFMQTAEQEVLRAQRYGNPLTVAVLDLDHFKTINDTYGHATGDHVLINRASLLEASVREVDSVGRLGGEEFAILMPGTPLSEAIQAIERIRQAFEQNPISDGEQLIRATASFGVAEYPGADPTVDALLAKADGALYLAKARGRNRVEIPAQKSIDGV
ncbi:MAG TPA: diguanylate cyclase [Rhodocyclaceae bacterium]|nr:diguanylate cyclase [Rhodocyclaceae bacterium]